MTVSQEIEFAFSPKFGASHSDATGVSARIRQGFLKSKVTDCITVENLDRCTRVLGLGMLMGGGRNSSARCSLNPASSQSRIYFHGTYTATPSESFIQSMTEQVRSVTPLVLTPTPDGATDFRLFRVWIENAVNGLTLQSGTLSGTGVLLEQLEKYLTTPRLPSLGK